MVSGVSILNFSNLRKTFRLLRSKIGLHRLFGLGTRNNLLKSPEMIGFLLTRLHFCLKLMQCLQQVAVPLGIAIAAYDGWKSY